MISLLHKYEVTLLHSDLPDMVEKSSYVQAQSLSDAIGKFARKHRLEAPAYWDEPSFEKELQLEFKRSYGAVTCLIRWGL